MSNYRNQLELYLKNLNIKVNKVIDVGGGANPIEGRVKEWDVDEYRIFDNSLEKFTNEIVNYDLQNKGLLGLLWEADIVFCLEVMEYIFNPSLALELLNNCLKDGGLLYITFPFIYPIHNPADYDYLRYTRAGATRLLMQSGFRVLDVQARGMTQLGYQKWLEFIKAEGMHMAKQSQCELGWIIKAEKL